MKVKCEWCKKEYERIRATSLYCSDKCRLAFHRSKVSVTDDTLRVSVTRPSIPAEVIKQRRRRVDDFRAVGGLNPESVGARPANWGLPDCTCLHCAQNKTNGGRSIINHGVWKPASLLVAGEINRVSLPSDVDYEGAGDKFKGTSRWRA